MMKRPRAANFKISDGVFKQTQQYIKKLPNKNKYAISSVLSGIRKLFSRQPLKVDEDKPRRQEAFFWVRVGLIVALY